MKPPDLGPISDISPPVAELWERLKKDGCCVFLYSGDLSTEAQDNATAFIEQELRHGKPE